MKLKEIVIFLLLALFLNACSRPEYVEEVAPPQYVVGYAPQQQRPQQPLPPLLPVKGQGIIVLDAGHGGKDRGAISPFMPKSEEKNLNLTTTQLVNHYLKQMGYQTSLSRPNDVFVELDKRAEFANQTSARLFVSIHYNSAPSAKAEGIEVFYYNSKENKDRTTQSKKLAQAVLDNVIKNTQTKSRGVKHGDLAVIRQTTMPAILIECGFLTNSNEMEKIKDPQYLKRLAWGISQGINQYLAKE